MAKIHIINQGCSTNLAESEMIAGLLSKAGFAIAKNPSDADVVIINVCTVKGEFTALRSIRDVMEEFGGKKMIIAGCITPSLVTQIREINEEASLVSTHNIGKIVDVMEEALQGNVIAAVTSGDERKICLPRIRKNPIVGVIPILSGCNNNCSYCSVKLVKGKLISYPKEEILKECLDSLKDGCKELWITSQDNASYGTENLWRSSLPELLQEILALPYDFKLRIGMMNLRNLRPIIDDMIKVYKNEKVFKFLHVPLQSGNDAILQKMNRNYNYVEFREAIEKFKKEIPNITFATDMIAGFPGETEEQFSDSVRAVKELETDILNISRFISREGTAAEKMEEKLPDEVSKKRTRILTDIFTNMISVRNEKWLGWTGEIIIDHKGKDDTWVGRNFNYKQIIVTGNYSLGMKIKVKVNKISTFYLKGEEIK